MVLWPKKLVSKSFTRVFEVERQKSEAPGLTQASWIYRGSCILKVTCRLLFLVVIYKLIQLIFHLMPLSAVFSIGSVKFIGNCTNSTACGTAI